MPQQLEVPAAAETPIETYVREGKLMLGCIHGAKYQTKTVKGPGGKMVKEFVLDAQRQKILLMSCGKLCEPNGDMCPRHGTMERAKEAAKPSAR